VPRVLVVDDDPAVCTAIQLGLQRRGFNVTVADSGEAGMLALEKADFDLMLIDIFMPRMRGLDWVKLFHRSAPATPLIAMSGYACATFAAPAPDFLTMTLELGATVCLRKPFTPKALLAAVNESLARPRAMARSSDSMETGR
jgi:DNA-binding response OmpR family regulator